MFPSKNHHQAIITKPLK